MEGVEAIGNDVDNSKSINSQLTLIGPSMRSIYLRLFFVLQFIDIMQELRLLFTQLHHLSFVEHLEVFEFVADVYSINVGLLALIVYNLCDRK